MNAVMEGMQDGRKDEMKANDSLWQAEEDCISGVLDMH